ncbi:hypothetical protein ACRALDRAFT_2041091 [Sodiomyces alcalophilus JCM 7366]|uniref:uncharacterized protein n=1 Tax=Sodiomyces alcalophilus JCM 7366 TaxID=591952 RepID=UPI0039B3EAA7
MAPAAPEYVFTRDYLDNNRINLQHYLWTELFGYVIHPKIPTDDPHLKIADVGTGTGVWLTSLSNLVPKSAQLDGLDISFDAAPPAGSLPPNVTLRKWNVKEAIPLELTEAYDFVHIRNFAFVLQDGDIPGVLRRLVRLISESANQPEPGGYLQWGEADVASFRIEKVRADAETDALRELLQLSQPQDSRLSPKWVSGLPRLFSTEGLDLIEADVRDAPPHLAWTTHQCNLLVHELLARQAGNQHASTVLQALMPRVVNETMQGSYWAFTRYTVVGRKPVATLAKDA